MNIIRTFFISIFIYSTTVMGYCTETSDLQTHNDITVRRTIPTSLRSELEHFVRYYNDYHHESHRGLYRNKANLLGHLLRSDNINQVRKKQTILTTVAQLGGSADLVEKIITAGATIRDRDEKLLLAATHYWNDVDTLEVLLKHGVSLEHTWKDGKKMIDIACGQSSYDVALHLLKKYNQCPQSDFYHEKLKKKENIDYNSSFLRAVKFGNLPRVQYLISKISNLNCCDEHSGWTALHFATEQRYYKIAKFLIYSGVNLEVKDKKGRVPMILTISPVYYDYIYFTKDRKSLRKPRLARLGADYSKNSKRVRDYKEEDFDMLRILARAGADYSMIGKLGFCPLTQ